MIQNILIFLAGYVVGVVTLIFTLALVSANK